MLTHGEIKAIMAKTFTDEHCAFTENDIKVGLINSHIVIQIKGYDHMTWKLFPHKPDVYWLDKFWVDVCEYMVLSKHPNDCERVACCGDNTNYPFKEALEYLAYHISRCVHEKTIAPYKEV